MNLSLKKPRLLLAAVAAAAVLVLSGCVAFLQPPGESQLDTIGDVELTIVTCASDPMDETMFSSCTEGQDVDDDTFQLLLSFLIPEGSEPPGTFDGRYGNASIVFTSSPALVSQLNAGKTPRPAGLKWVGYISDRHDYVQNSDVQGVNVKVRFGLPRGADGSPFAGPFRYIAVLGVRRVNDSTLLESRPVVCDTGASQRTQCGDDSEPEDLELPSGELATHEVETRDLGVLAEAASAAAGSNATVPFTLKYAGAADPAANFALEAATNLPGASATPGVASLTPAADSSNPVGVNVAVPAGTPPGVYDVSLTAKLPNGQARSNTAKLTVTAPAASPPAQDSKHPTLRVSLVRGQDIESLLRSGLKLKVAMDEAGSQSLALTTGSASLARNVTIGKRSIRFGKAETKTVRLKLNRRARSRRARRALLGRSRLRLVVRSTAMDLAGNVQRGSKRLSLKR